MIVVFGDDNKFVAYVKYAILPSFPSPSEECASSEMSFPFSPCVFETTSNVLLEKVTI